MCRFRIDKNLYLFRNFDNTLSRNNVYSFYIFYHREIENVDLRVGYGNVKNKVSHLSYLEITIIKLIEKVSINYYSVTKLSMFNYSSVTAEVNENFVNYMNVYN